MSAILAVYGTAYGQTELIVRRLAGHLERLGFTIAAYRGDALPADLDVDQFDGVLVAASVIRAKHQPYVRAFVTRYRDQLARRPTAFVSVSGAAGSPLPDKRAEAKTYADEFLRQTGWRPTVTALVGGALAYTKYNFLLRWIIKRISRQMGGPTDTTRDHETTDWAAVERFATTFAEAMAHPAVR
jgi:menaquinone-dependent protoporphyrinogen oxidase